MTSESPNIPGLWAAGLILAMVGGVAVILAAASMPQIQSDETVIAGEGEPAAPPVVLLLPERHAGKVK